MDTQIGDALLDKLRIDRPRFSRTLEPDIFPSDAIHFLRHSGFLAAPLPRSAGGFGWGTEPAGSESLRILLQAIGYESLSVGRIYEAHVNAIALIFNYGEHEIRTKAADAARQGHLFGLWVAPADKPVRIARFGSYLSVIGRKSFCTAAAIASRAVITAHDENDNERLVLVDTREAQVDQNSTQPMMGMRNTLTKAMIFDQEVPLENCFGNAGDYLHEPDFSAGAWRTTAVTVGGLRALIDETIRQLKARGRHENPHQAARIGHMLIKYHSSEMWVRSVVHALSSHGEDPRSLIAHVNLARLAVEEACLEVIALVQRSLGLSSLATNNPVEGMMRDLMTYLRQPAADEVLTEAATTLMESKNPTSLGTFSQ